jgi:hypothetical protein
LVKTNAELASELGDSIESDARGNESMTVIRLPDSPMWPSIPPSFEMILAAIVICLLEIAFTLLVYGFWGYGNLRSRQTTVKTEIGRFIKSFVVVFAIINVLWVFMMLNSRNYDVIFGTVVAIPLVLIACAMEIAISKSVYNSRYGKSLTRSTSIGTEITRFIIIFMAIFTIVNASWIDIWVIIWH